MRVFDILIWAGSALTVMGLCALIWCIIDVARARKSLQSDEELREKLKKVVPVNLAALAMSAIGLMCVIMGIVLA